MILIEGREKTGWGNHHSVAGQKDDWVGDGKELLLVPLCLTPMLEVAWLQEI